MIKHVTLAALLAATLAAPRLGHARPEYQCHKKIKPQNAIAGKHGTYQVKEGLKSGEYNGLLERAPAKVENGCFLPALRSDHCVVMQLDEAAWAGGNRKMQCVLSDDPGSEIKPGQVLAENAVDAHEMLLKSPNTTGYESDAADNSGRSQKRRDALKQANQRDYSICVRRALVKTDPRIGKTIFCQLYDQETGTVLVAAELVVEAPR